jgi:enediyne biosynthesis protein E4
MRIIIDHTDRCCNAPRGLVLWGMLLMLTVFGGVLAGCNPPPQPVALTPDAEPPIPEQRVEPNASAAPDTAARGVSKVSPFSIPDISRAHATRAVSTDIRLTDVASGLGLHHVYDNGATGESWIAETIGGGVGWLDYDNDGRVDLVANQAGKLSLVAEESNRPDALFRNHGERFVSVERNARFTDLYYSQGVSIGDMDNDGFEDIYISNLGRNTLWRNQGDGTFQEISRLAGVDDERWSVSAAWCDLDRDGNLDLYVGNYVHFDPSDPQVCRAADGRPALCNIASFQPVPDACFFSNGDGTFRELAQQRQLFGAGNRALGVAVCDFNLDGWPDIYVANDTTANFLFINAAHEDQFEDLAPLLGCHLDRMGATQGSMGIAVGDIDHNSLPDLYCTNFYEESNTLYMNHGESGFRDMTALLGLHQPTLAMLGFGTQLEDWNADGKLELLVANGHVDNSPGNIRNFEMLPQFFVQRDGRWHSVGEQLGEYFHRRWVGRGVAGADYDGDGGRDVAVIHQRAPLALLRNESPLGNHLTLSLVGVQSNRFGIGCRVTVHTRERTLTREMCGGTSYASSHHHQLYFGLGGQDHSAEPVDIIVLWPSGLRQELSQIMPNQSLTVVEPAG